MFFYIYAFDAADKGVIIWMVLQCCEANMLELKAWIDLLLLELVIVSSLGHSILFLLILLLQYYSNCQLIIAATI